MTSKAQKTLALYRKHYISDIWDLRETLVKIYGIPKDHMHSSKYKIDFSSLHGSRICEELKIVFLYAAYYKNLKRTTFSGSYLSCIGGLISYIHKTYSDGSFPDLMELSAKKDGESFSKYMKDQKKKYMFAGSMISVFQHLWQNEFLAGSYFERDIWESSHFNLRGSRFNFATAHSRFYFEKLQNPHNKTLIKKYILYQFSDTDHSFGTISEQFSVLSAVAAELGSLKFKDADKTFWTNYLAKLNTRFEKTNSFNRIIYILGMFYSFGTQRKYWPNAPVRFNDFRQRSHYHYEDTGLAPEIRTQIFACLSDLDPVYYNMFLLLYYSGMRGSEAACFKMNGLIDCGTEKHIRYYQSKMKKEVEQVIVPSVYQHLNEYRKKIIAENPDETYLFARAPGKPVFTSTFRDAVNAVLENHNVCYSDGTKYIFRIHTLRHDFAVRMLKDGVPFISVQQTLHHKSPEMTVQYAQAEEEQRKKKYAEYLKKMNPDLPAEEKTVDENVHWMRYMISQVLPNGYCSLPVKLGTCPNANKCLFCDKFRTSAAFLKVLQLQLSRTIALQKNCNDEQQRKSLDKVILKLEDFIKEIGDDNGSFNSSDILPS